MIDEELDSPNPDPRTQSPKMDLRASETLKQNGVINVAGNCVAEDNDEDGKSWSNNNFAIKDENRQKVIASGNNLVNGLLPFSLEMKETEKRMSDQSSLVCSSLLHFEGQSQLEKGKQQKAHLVSMSKEKEKIKFSPSKSWSKQHPSVDKEINGLSPGRITVSKSPLSTNGESGNNERDINEKTTKPKKCNLLESDASKKTWENEVAKSNMENGLIESGHLGNDTSSKMDWLSLASSLKLSATKSLETDLNTSPPPANSIQLSELDSKKEKVKKKSENEILLPRDESRPEAINIFFESRCQKSSNRSFNYDVEDEKRRRSTANIQSCAPSDVLQRDLESSSNKMENEMEERNEQQLRQHSMCTQVKTENNFLSSKTNNNNSNSTSAATLKQFSSEVNLSHIDEHGRITTNLHLLAPKKEEPLEAEMGSYCFDGELKFMIEEVENKFLLKEEKWSDKEIEIVGEKFVPQQRFFLPHGTFFLPRSFSCCYPRLSCSNLFPCMCSNVTQISRHAGIARLKKCYVRMDDAKAVCDAFVAATKHVRKKGRALTGKRKIKLIEPTYVKSLCETNYLKRGENEAVEEKSLMGSKSCETEERTKATSNNKKRMSVISKSAARFKPKIRPKICSSEDSNNDVCSSDLKLTIKINNGNYTLRETSHSLSLEPKNFSYNSAEAAKDDSSFLSSNSFSSLPEAFANKKGCLSTKRFKADNNRHCRPEETLGLSRENEKKTKQQTFREQQQHQIGDRVRSGQKSFKVEAGMTDPKLLVPNKKVFETEVSKFQTNNFLDINNSDIEIVFEKHFN
jgi:hypothetical protein